MPPWWLTAFGTADASGNGNATATPSDASTSMNYNDVIGGVCRGGHSSSHERRRPSSALRHPNDNNNGLSSSSSPSSVIDGMRNELTRAAQLARTALNNDGNGGENNDVTSTMTAAAASSFITGTAAFYATSFISQLAQYKLLKCSTGTRPSLIPSSIGMVTVAIGSWMGHVVGMGTTQHVLLCAAANARRRRQSEYYNHDDAPYCNNDDDSSRWRLRSTSENTSEDDGDDDYNSKRITNIMLAQLSEMGHAVWKSTIVMTRPLFLGMVSMDNHDKIDDYNNTRQQLTKRQRAERKEAWTHMGRICLVGLLTYKIGCGARFISSSPSSYTARGSFARVSIPATPPPGAITNGDGFAYATASQRCRIEKLGRIFGCHTCGSRELFFTKLSNLGGPTFHGDHIPPISVAKQLNDRWYRKLIGVSVSQRFYPQCITCSNKQGGLLSRAVYAGHRNLRSVGGGQESYFHGRRVRLSHTTGGIVAVLSVGGLTTNDDNAMDLVKSSRERMQFMQHWIEDVGMKTKRWIVNAWPDMK